MAGRGSQSFKKRQKEQQRKEKAQDKLAKRLERKHNPLSETPNEPFEVMDDYMGDDDSESGEVPVPGA